MYRYLTNAMVILVFIAFTKLSTQLQTDYVINSPR